MPLGNCLFAAAATAPAQVNRRGVSVSPACCVRLRRHRCLLLRHVSPPSPAGTLQGRTAQKLSQEEALEQEKMHTADTLYCTLRSRELYHWNNNVINHFIYENISVQH